MQLSYLKERNPSMRLFLELVAVLLSMSLIVSGCATFNYDMDEDSLEPHEGKEDKTKYDLSSGVCGGFACIGANIIGSIVVMILIALAQSDKD